jgi:hypothetical protein
MPMNKTLSKAGTALLTIHFTAMAAESAVPTQPPAQPVARVRSVAASRSSRRGWLRNLVRATVHAAAYVGGSLSDRTPGADGSNRGHTVREVEAVLRS